MKHANPNRGAGCIWLALLIGLAAVGLLLASGLGLLPR